MSKDTEKIRENKTHHTSHLRWLETVGALDKVGILLSVGAELTVGAEDVVGLLDNVGAVLVLG